MAGRFNMNASIVLDKVGRLKPNALTEDDLIDLINEIERDIAENILHTENYTLVSNENKNVELLAPPIYERIYFEYVCAKIDYFGDVEFYTLTGQQFNETRKELLAYCIKNGLTKSFGRYVDYH